MKPRTMEHGEEFELATKNARPPSVRSSKSGRYSRVTRQSESMAVAQTPYAHGVATPSPVHLASGASSTTHDLIESRMLPNTAIPAHHVYLGPPSNAVPAAKTVIPAGDVPESITVDGLILFARSPTDMFNLRYSERSTL